MNDDQDEDDSTTSSTTTPLVTDLPDGARLLASQCFQCHGTDGKSVTGIDSLAGESASEIIEEMQEMKQEQDHELMHFQALGYSDAQIQTLAQFFASQTDSGFHERDDHDDDDD